MPSFSWPSIGQTSSKSPAYKRSASGVCLAGRDLARFRLGVRRLDLEDVGQTAAVLHPQLVDTGTGEIDAAW